ncbi:MAG: hypothetical protein U5J63_04660 [Fodinibius sp.]|nr:hypothetical protein [Fodinibius sp.]
MKNIKESSWSALNGWKDLFEAMTTGIIVVDSEDLCIKRYNNSAKKVFSEELEPGKIITQIDHGLVYNELASD